MDFASFVANRQSATLPLVAGNLVPVIQGVTKWVDVTNFSGNWSRSLALTASGTTPATALSLPSNFNEIVVTFGGAYAQLNPQNVLPIIVVNYGGNDLLVLPNSGAQFNQLGVNTPYTVVNGSGQLFFPSASNQIYTIP